MIRGILRSPDFVLWKALAWLAELPAQWRLTRLAAAGIRFNRWQKRLARLGPGSTIYPHVVIHRPDLVSIGSNAAIAEFVHMWGGGGILIGDNVMIASHTIITSQTHEVAIEDRRANVARRVTIGNDVWVGAGAIILPGVTIGDGSVIAAGAVVTGDVPARAVVAGIPARIARSAIDAVA